MTEIEIPSSDFTESQCQQHGEVWSQHISLECRVFSVYGADRYKLPDSQHLSTEALERCLTLLVEQGRLRQIASGCYAGIERA